MQKIDRIYSSIMKQSGKWSGGFTAAELAAYFQLDRSTASRYLNSLAKKNKLEKTAGKPVRYFCPTLTDHDKNFSQHAVHDKTSPPASNTIHFSEQIDQHFIGADESLKMVIEKGMAALFYPEQGLHILLSGETGVGKSYLAEYLAQIAAAKPWNRIKAPFITFNCADYAQNPELLMGHIFGIKKGAFTGAEKNEVGLVEQANNGILFLDEIHRLPPSGQEMLFYLIDKGLYRRLGDTDKMSHAKLILIGATTETLESTLLPTLLRRFTLKLSIPPLRERTHKEREEFLTYFLKSEAKKMKLPLLIEDYCRKAFLKYACPGNIGQLKSDIQISCARAFMRHLQEGTEKVTIQRNDIPSQVLSSMTRNEFEVDHKTSHLVTSGKSSGPLPIQTIYSILAKMKKDANDDNFASSSENSMKTAVDHYLEELKSLSEKRLESEPSWVRFIDHDLLDALRDSEFYFKDDFTFEYGSKQTIAIGLHLEAFRQQSSDAPRSSLPDLPMAKPLYRKAAAKLAEFLQNRIQLVLPASEIELLAHLMASTTIPENKREGGVLVFLVTHGRSTASSMAEVTNYLLGSPIIHPVDMPLTEATGVTYKKVRQFIVDQDGKSGILMLVDIGSLVTMGESLSHDLGIPIRTLANVNMPMLIEAGRKALITENDLETVYEASRQAFFALAPKDQLLKQPKEVKQRLIVTVCLTGEGTAQLLHDWLSEQLSAEDNDVAVRAIRIDPVSHDSTMLSTFQKQYHLIAIVGTVPVTFENVPYIPALELLRDDGHSRLHRLLEVTRPLGAPYQKEKTLNDQEMRELAPVGLGKIVRHLNPVSYAKIAFPHYERISTFYQWNTETELGMWMHLGSLADQIIEARLVHGPDPAVPDELKELDTQVTERDLTVWAPLFADLESQLHLSIDLHLQHSLIVLGKQQQSA